MEKIKNISIDIETFSDRDLQKCGVYKYVESDKFDILLFGYSIDDINVNVIDLANGETIPKEILNALIDNSIYKWEFNSQFERICISEWLKRNNPDLFEKGKKGNYLNPKSWRCSMIWSAYMGIQLSLEGVGAVLKLSDQKLKEGKDLIKYFSMPCSPTKTNGMRDRNLPNDDKYKWELFKKYNKRDVEVEIAIRNKLKNNPIPEFVWDEFYIDQEINDRGILIDKNLVDKAIKLDEIVKNDLMTKMKELTNLENPNSVSQVRGWLSDNGIETDSLGKKQVKELINNTTDTTNEVLRLRQKLAKSSIKKYQAMNDTMCNDNRARGMFQFYGAARSGRWAGRHIQLQNLPQNHLPDLYEARELLKTGAYDTFTILYEDTLDTLSQLIRTAFIPRDGYKFIVADFSAIEARVLSHLAKEKWRIDTFSKNRDIYCASASQMFHVPVEKHGVNSHLRQKGKIAELALGYGGSVGALKSMGALEMGLKEEELKPLVDMWRESNPNIKSYWYKVNTAVLRAIDVMNKSKNNIELSQSKKEPIFVDDILFEAKQNMLFIHLPSGRQLSYVKPKIEINENGYEVITYESRGMNKKWERVESYGPKFVENIVQAISRDLLAEAMKRLKDELICGHVHDEIIIECKKDTKVSDICKIMSKAPKWMPDIVLNADGFECDFYKKD